MPRAQRKSQPACLPNAENTWNVAVAVVDNPGILVYFERMDNTQTASMDIAVGKARAAATYRRTTRVFMDAINKGGMATVTLPGVFASPGGVPIMVDGKVTGGVGVSGVSATKMSNAPRPVSGSPRTLNSAFSVLAPARPVVVVPARSITRWRVPSATIRICAQTYDIAPAKPPSGDQLRADKECHSEPE